MASQRRIQRRLAEPDALARVGALLEAEPSLHRTALADRLCAEYEFFDPAGRLQRSSCLKALRTLAGRGHFVLPPPRTSTGRPHPRRLGSPVPPPQGVPESAGAVRDLTLVRVETEEQRRIWNELFLGEHPRGAGPLVGRQLHYLVHSAHGWLGGLAFAAAALQLHARDRWIGWEVEDRRAHLDRVVGLSRFLIRPMLRCQNLASQVLGRALAQLPEDFETRYGYAPWLVETFVDTAQVAGTCFQATNWTRVGTTRGRGRQDRDREQAESVKEIYVYPLVPDFRTRMGIPLRRGQGPLPLDAGLEGGEWAEQEFDGAPLGDARWSRRLVESARVQAQNPLGSFTGAAQGDRALVKGYYRFIDQPDESALTVENVLLPHREQTLRRMQAEPTVLCIQDGTDLNFDGLAECEGLGVIGTNQTDATTRGLHLHSTLAVNEEGVPLGVLRLQCEAPVSRSPQDTRPAYEIPIEEKETYAWIRGLRDLRSAAAAMPHTRLVSVMDRHADLFELFDEWRHDPSVDLLVRAQHNRGTTAEKNLFDAVRTREPRLKLELVIGRQSARPKRSKQKARPRRPARTAAVTLRYRKIEVAPPFYHHDKAPVPLWIIQVCEEDPPAGVRPIEWFLLSTLELASPEQALRCVEWYCLRWRIEDWHRVLKSGCEIEELGHKSAERLGRAVAIHAVIAWRIMLMTLLGREDPELPPDVLFSDLELQVLHAYAQSRRDLPAPNTVKNAVWIVASMGGYLRRKSDPPPGHQLLWQGYLQLHFMCIGFSLRPTGPDP
ncbi:MAG: IS4 family transposase [Gemmatimonas sp.]|nr:IS4 family transposase [Gemmatimonas sp.]